MAKTIISKKMTGSGFLDSINSEIKKLAQEKGLNVDQVYNDLISSPSHEEFNKRLTEYFGTDLKIIL